MTTDRRLFFLFHRAHRALFVRSNALCLEVLGVTTAQLGALYYVAKNEGCSLSNVAEVLDMNKSAMTALAGRLEKLRVLRREANPSDARGTRVYLTEKGKDVRTQSLAVIRNLTAEVTKGFTDDEMDVVYRFLSALIERCREEDA